MCRNSSRVADLEVAADGTGPAPVPRSFATFNSLDLFMKRIGFIAMSGVRAHNEELTKLGLTLPGFVDRNRIIASLPSLGLLTLAGLTPKKFDVEYHEIADLKKLPELPTHFDLVAISTFTAQIKEAYKVA